MRLKRLKIIGFKSFADNISLNFDAEIIGIVGPNGCGKSNIVDAFRWVLGEQSAKSLRGEKMQDVLFAGTEKRKPLNVAEVSVTLTEVGDSLSLDYDEITIARRLHRSGESEYLINGELVRLKDIQHLFMGTGIGKNAFSVFEQGKLDQVINLSPLERRSIFDESAGISRFLQQKKESLRKLHEVKENYLRVKDVHSEVDKQTRQLKKQAALAKSYQENTKHLENLEKATLVARWDFAFAKSYEGSQQYDIIKGDVKKAQMALQTSEKRSESIKKHLVEKEKESRTFQEKVYQAQGSAKVKKVEEARLQDQILELDQREKKLLKELQEFDSKREKERSEIVQKEQRLAKLQIEKERLEKEVREKFSIFHSIELEVNTLRDEIQLLQKKRFEASQEESHLARQLQEKILRLEAAQERLQSLQKQIIGKKEVFQKSESQINEKRTKIAALSCAIDELKNQAIELTKEATALKLKIADQQKILQVMRQEAAEFLARLKALSRLKEEREGFSNGAKQILKESQNPKSPLYKKVEGLFEHILPKKGDEKKLATALKQYSETLVVHSFDDLELLIRCAEEKKWKDFSVICLALVSEKNSTKTKIPQLEKNSSLAFHFLKDLMFVEDLSALLETLRHEGRISVTPEGYFVDYRQVVHQLSAGQEENNAFLREAEIKSLEKKVEELKAKITQEEEVLEKRVQNRAQIEEKQKGIDEERRKQEMNLLQENFSLQKFLSDIENGKKEVISFEEEQRKLLSSSEEYTLLIDQLKLQVKMCQEKSQEVIQHVQDFEKKLQLRLTALKGAKEEHQKYEITLRHFQADWHKVNHEIKIHEAKNQESEQHQKKHLGELQFVCEKVKEARSRLLSLEAEAKALGLEFEEIKGAFEKISQEHERWKEEWDEVEKQMSEHRNVVAHLESERHRFEVAMAEDISTRKNLERELHERFQISIEEVKALKIPLEGTLEESEKIIRRLRLEIEKAGAVNMASIEECRQQEERFHFLDKQLNDLEATKTDLEEIIAKLEVESRKLFKSSFEAIRKNFLKNFQILFNGGEADLKFTESSDVLEAGVEIIAKPPGKQMKAISLMSGGEKCMTALALLFSIFEVRPAPFCILDEVDAPLDDTNIDRFTNVLKQFIQTTQFIIVTHNKKTMAIADILFGVSMEEKGVSKLISLVFERKKQEALQ